MVAIALHSACGGIVADRPVPPPKYDEIAEHVGCVAPPCCTGGSADTWVEVSSECKYLVKGLLVCGCYAAADLDPAVARCIEANRTKGDACGGLDCGSIQSCSSVRVMLFDLGVSDEMPPLLPGCDRSERHIHDLVYGDTCDQARSP